MVVLNCFMGNGFIIVMTWGGVIVMGGNSGVTTGRMINYLNFEVGNVYIDL